MAPNTTTSVPEEIIRFPGTLEWEKERKVRGLGHHSNTTYENLINKFWAEVNETMQTRTKCIPYTFYKYFRFMYLICNRFTGQLIEAQNKILVFNVFNVKKFDSNKIVRKCSI